MKKKIIALVLASILLVGGVIGGAVAYLTDEDKIENVFVLGDIDITMHELMRDKTDPSKLVAFEQNQVLLPGFANPSWEKYEWSLADLSGYGDAWKDGALPSTCWNDLFNSTTYGVMDKFIFVENTGKTDAYFRTVIAIESPAGLTDDKISYNISSFTGYDWNQNTPEVDTGVSNLEVIENVVIRGVTYDIIVANYVNVLQPGEVARPSFLQVGLNANATNEDMELLGDELTVLVATQAVQCYGFEANALAALEAGFGKVTANNHPFLPVWDGSVDTSWYNDTDTEFVLDDESELAGFAALVNAGNSFKGKTVKLGCDMNLGNLEWTPIANTNAVRFDGTFDGCEYTISNLKISSGSSVGLFGYAWISATIKNINMDGVSITATNYVAPIIGNFYGDLIDNCHVKNAKIDGSNKVAGIVGLTGSDTHMTITNCSVEDTAITATRNAGCIAGYAKIKTVNDAAQGCYFENCTFSGVTVDWNGDNSHVESNMNIVVEIVGEKG